MDQIPATDTIPDIRLSLLQEGPGNHLPITVLVVDDSHSVRIQLGRFIRRLENVTLMEASSLEGARQILNSRKDQFFCGIVDLTLPDAVHGEVVDLLKSEGVPVIVLTGSFSPALRKSMWDRGIIDYMVKSSISSLEDIAYLVGCLRQNRFTQVLVVDDSELFRCYLRELLDRYRFPVLVAANGREGIALLEQNTDIALIITDYLMPEMNGIDMVRQIRRRHRREALPIIALSDSARPDLSAAMIKAGANDFLHKTFQLEEFYCRVQQNTQMGHVFRQLRDFANKDYLTRLYNRRHFFQVAEDIYQKACAGNRPVAIAMLDLDHFKRINDNFGHPFGDEVLRKAADSLLNVLAPANLLARYGGEEFICLISGRSANEVASLLGAARRSVESLRLGSEGAPVMLSVSVGYTTDPGANLADMIERADQAVYRAKVNGRNRVECDGPGPV